jgi:hypothetical protein
LNYALSPYKYPLNTFKSNVASDSKRRKAIKKNWRFVSSLIIYATLSADKIGFIEYLPSGRTASAFRPLLF